MARTRTTPVVTRSIVTDTVERFGLVIDRRQDGSIINRNVRLTYQIANRDDAGEPVNYITERLRFSDVGANTRKTLRDLHDAILAHAEAQGHIGAGTDDDELV